MGEIVTRNGQAASGPRADGQERPRPDDVHSPAHWKPLDARGPLFLCLFTSSWFPPPQERGPTGSVWAGGLAPLMKPWGGGFSFPEQEI